MTGDAGSGDGGAGLGDGGAGAAGSGSSGEGGQAGSGSGSVGWCGTRVRPSGVLASDYQCVDFDENTADVAVWVPVTVGDGTLEWSAAKATSLPLSMRASVPQVADYASRATAAIQWSNVGAAPIESLSLSFAMNPEPVPTLIPQSTGDVSIACLELGEGEACLDYTVNRDPDGFTGLSVSWVFSGGPAVASSCEVTEDLDPDLWNDVVLTVAQLGAIDVTINGVLATAECNGIFGPDTVALFTAGLAGHQVTSFGYDVHYDNLVAFTRRTE